MRCRISLLLFFFTIIPAVASVNSTPLEEFINEVQQDAKRGNYKLIEVDELWSLYQRSNQDILLIDTRQEWEFRTGHIRGAVNFSIEPTWFSRLINRHALAQKLPENKKKILIFY